MPQSHTQTMAKFQHPKVTAKGEERAWVDLNRLDTLWFNTGTRCNLACEHCYIESSPSNDRLAFLTVDDVRPYLDELRGLRWDTHEIGLTGGEPLINPNIIPIMELTLERGFDLIVLTNAFNVIGRHKRDLGRLNQIYGPKMLLRVSLDHYSAEFHDSERGPDTFAKTLKALKWLNDQGFHVGVAGRSRWGEDVEAEKQGYKRLFETHGIDIDMTSSKHFVVFPEMGHRTDVPEITTSCWGILDKRPDDVMCSSSRMVIKRNGAPQPTIVACTLLAYDPQFEVGTRLADMDWRVLLNHRHCAEFCVLGGASCSGS